MNLVQIGISVYGQDLFQVKSCIESCLIQDNCMITCRIDGPDACGGDVLTYLKLVDSSVEKFELIAGSRRIGNFASLNNIFATSDTPFLCQVDADDMLALA